MTAYSEKTDKCAYCGEELKDKNYIECALAFIMRQWVRMGEIITGQK